MLTTKIFNEYKEITYGFITLAVLLPELLGLTPKALDKEVVKAIVVILIVGLGILFELFARRVVLWQSQTQTALEELEHDLLTNRRKAIVVFRNAPFPDLANLVQRLSGAIRQQDWWDWTYLGPHPDCDKLCGGLFDELKQVYMNSPESEEIKTSSVRFLAESSLRRKNLIFMGDVVVGEDRGDPKDFPDSIWSAGIAGTHEVDFSKVYVLQSAWRADTSECTICSGYVERDPVKISKMWEQVHKTMRLQLGKSDTLLYKECPPETKERKAFFAKLKTHICKGCKSSSFFVVSPFAGNAFSISRKGLEGNLWAKSFVFFGWLLSPLSFYNDTYINVPLALIMSYPIVEFIGWNKIYVTGLAYILTNILGVVLVFIGLLIGGKAPTWRIPLVKTLIGTVIFTLVSIMLGLIFFR
jgi:hypothetical protein